MEKFCVDILEQKYENKSLFTPRKFIPITIKCIFFTSKEVVCKQKLTITTIPFETRKPKAVPDLGRMRLCAS